MLANEALQLMEKGEGLPCRLLHWSELVLADSTVISIAIYSVPDSTTLTKLGVFVDGNLARGVHLK